MSSTQRETTRDRSRSFAHGRFFLLLAGAGAMASSALADAGGPPALAAANFVFRDTSGEVRDQSAEHEARLKAFNAALRNGFLNNPQVDLVALTCRAAPCTAIDPGLDALSTQARAAGARHLLFGEVHKMSTLVGWVRFAVLDLHTDAPVCDRFLSYRGDTDEAWQHAANATLRDIETNCLP